MDNMDDVQNII